MTQFVLDASVSLRWLLDDPIPAYAATVRAMLSSGSRALVPSLWHLEMLNGMIVIERRKLILPHEVDRALVVLNQICAQSVDTDWVPISPMGILTAARSFQLSAYDAAYLELARREGLPIASLDQSVRSAVSRAKVELLQ